MKFVIGLIGKICSGKTMTVDYICSEFDAESYKFSEILTDILNVLNLPNERRNLQILGRTLRENLGHEVIVNAMNAKIEKSTKNVIVIDGVRYQNEVDMIMKFKNNMIIKLETPIEERYKRSSSRNEKSDEKKLSFEQFKNNENKETEIHIDETGKHADYVIENTGTKEELFEKIDEIIKNTFFNQS